MTDAVRHRGPDDEGYWHDSSVGLYLGHRRLAIVDLERGSQPMASADGNLVITYNGEIYNHAEIRRQLERRGHRFLTDHSDTEVILNGYREWGAEVVHHLNGMWAFALVDRRSRRLLLSRDRFGEKPLYFTSKPGFFAFASELTALLRHPALEQTLSVRGLLKYFAYGYVPAPTTLVDGVSKLPAGTVLTLSLDDGAVSSRSFWKYELEPSDELRDLRQAGEGLVEHLRRAVEMRMVADVDVGVLLSGGIDSAAVATLAGGATRLQTFNLGFDDPSFDESKFAQLVSRALGSSHHSEIMRIDQALLDLPSLACMLDEPLGDSSILPTWHISRLARSRVKVVLTGDGGDELLAGYDPIRALGLSRLIDRLTPKPLPKALSVLAARLPVSDQYMSPGFRLSRWLRGVSAKPSLWIPSWMAPLDLAGLSELLSTPVELEDVYEEAIASWERGAHLGLVDRATQFFTDIYLASNILTKTDRATMMHGLEARAPFLDVNVADYVRRLPSRFKYARGQRKRVLKQGLIGLVPSEVLTRPKHGFAMPVGRWFRDDLLTLLPSDPAVGSAHSVSKRLEAHRTGATDERLFLWCYWVLVNSGLLKSHGGAVVSAV